MMSFFTLVTLYDALYNPVPDCGCFGEAIKLTNWETFYKNVVLMVFTLVIILSKPSKRAIANTLTKNIGGVLAALLFLGFSWVSYQHLPPVDFRDWKVGNDMKQTGEPVYYLVYKNNSNGEQQRYLSSELPWNDSTWMSNWSFVRQEIDRSNVVKPHNLQIMTLDGDDMTKQLIEAENYQFLVTSYNLQQASSKGISKIIEAYRNLESNRFEFALITASLEEEITDFERKYNTDIPVYQADDIELKSMVRANPGVILLHDGIIINKWHYNDFPSAKEINNNYHSN
ncbi:MAG TPA: BT_3928 family protein, partial [Bacteroidales bacterium]|nr:BT_3928 family protein [Bacteroidales bacterium]